MFIWIVRFNIQTFIDRLTRLVSTKFTFDWIDFTTISIRVLHTKTFKMHISLQWFEKDQMVARTEIKERKYDANTDQAIKQKTKNNCIWRTCNAPCTQWINAIDMHVVVRLRDRYMVRFCATSLHSPRINNEYSTRE